MGYASNMAKSLLTAITIFSCGHGLAAPVNYEITFTQTWLSHQPGTSAYEWLGPRLISGYLSIDDSVLGPPHANTIYGPDSPELQAIQTFTLTLDSKVYQFNQWLTGMVAGPPITSVIRTDSLGAIVDLQGAFTLPGSISQIFLGRDGNEGAYVDVQEINPVTSVGVSGGTYAVSLVSSVPEPATTWMFGGGVILLSAAAWRRKTIETKVPSPS
jgi:hypothetical protein